MSANVETMMYVREKPWHGIGTEVQEAPTSAKALELAGLDWEVLSNPIYDQYGAEIPNYKANTRSSDYSVLGVVTDRYKIVQNTEAFQFTDSLIGNDVHYECAGSLNKGRRIWLLARLPDTEIVGDKTETYCCFTNTHDGTGAVRVCMTPVRVVCQNTLSLALSTASRTWSCKHMGDIQNKLDEARMSLEMANAYMDALSVEAMQMANTSVSDERIREILNEMFPYKDTDSDRIKNNMERVKEEFMVCYYMPDLDKFRGTAWGAVNAMVDMVDHTEPLRKTGNYRENNWGRIMDGHQFVDTIKNKLMAGVGV